MALFALTWGSDFTLAMELFFLAIISFFVGLGLTLLLPRIRFPKNRSLTFSHFGPEFGDVSEDDDFPDIDGHTGIAFDNRDLEELQATALEDVAEVRLDRWADWSNNRDKLKGREEHLVVILMRNDGTPLFVSYSNYPRRLMLPVVTAIEQSILEVLKFKQKFADETEAI